MQTTRCAGRARPLLAALVVAVALVALLLRFGGAPSPSSSAALPPETPAPEVVQRPGPAPAIPSRETAPADAPERAPGTTSEEPLTAGTIEVSIVGGPRESALGEAEVVASRWRSHPAAEAEVAGRLVIPAGMDRGLLQLAPGSYALQARAAGWTSAPLRVELQEPLLRADVVLTLTGCAALMGFVVRDSGDPVQDLAVHLIDDSGQLVESGLTAFGGDFRLRVPMGSWWLVVGTLEGPLFGPRKVFVDTGGAGLGELVLPPLGTVEIAVQDEAGAPVPDLELSGQGGTGGRLQLRTDFGGSASSELALPGLWRFFADAGPLGRGNAVLEVEAGGRAQATLTLRRPR